MKKLRRINILVICLAFIALVFSFNFSLNVNAYPAEFSNQAATYKVKEVKDSKDLGYGVKYHRDIGSLKFITDDFYNYVNGNSAGLGGGNGIVKNKEYGQQVNVLEITPSEDVQLVPYAVLEGPNWHASTVMDAAEQYERTHVGRRVVAAINGDFFQISKDIKTSTGSTVGDGEFFKANSGHGSGQNIGIRNSGSGLQLATINVYESQLVPTVTFYDETGAQILKLEGGVSPELLYNGKGVKVNAEPEEGEISFFYATRVKNYLSQINECVVSDVWYADYAKDSSIAVTSMKGSFYGKAQISDYINGEIRFGEGRFAIKSKNAEADKLLKKGVTVRCQYEFCGPNKEFNSAIGFPFKVLENGTALVNDKTRHPRTIIGQREDGTMILSVVDGRQRSLNMYGATCVEMGAIMSYYGCTDAWNLDGGGSSTLLVRKQNGWEISEAYNADAHLHDSWYVTNSPSDGSERRDGNCLLIVAKVPEVKISIAEVTSNTVKLNVAQLTTIEKYKDLYIMLNDKTYKVEEDGTVNGVGLEDKTFYTAFLYAKVGDQMYNMMTELTFVTCFITPNKVEVEAVIRNRKGIDHVLIKFKTPSRDGIKNIYFMVGDERFGTPEPAMYIKEFEDLYDALLNIDVNIIFKGSPVTDQEILTFEDIQVKIDTEFALHEIKYRNNTLMDEIFGLPAE